MRNVPVIRGLALVLAAVLVLGLLPGAYAASEERSFRTIAEYLEEQRFTIDRMDPETEVEFIVELQDVPLADALPAGMKLADYLNTRRGIVRAKAIDRQQRLVAAAIESCADAAITHTYRVVLNGFAVRASCGDRAKLEALEGVRRVTLGNTYEVPEPMGTEGTPVTSGAWICADAANAEGYTGKGVFAAVLDTGLMVDHEAFDGDAVQGAEVTAETVAALSGLTARGQVYRNAKVAFAYDYADRDNDVSDTQGHGTHVAGIVAANGETFRGVAPDAQLAVMKVFSDDGTAADSAIFAALEDCVILGVDTVNMSLGAPCGFAYEDAVTDAVYEKVRGAGINLMIAAGNDYNAAYRNLQGTDLALAGNPDYGIVGAPSTYGAAMSVASVSADDSIVALSDFSSMGVAPDLSLKPEISAPGGNIRSASISGGYEEMSGTSMAAPHMTGAAALVRQYVNGAYTGLSDFEKQELVDALLMSTAVPVLDENGVAYSPRKQGAGLTNVCAAIHAESYLTVDGGRPKAQLGESGTGVYEFSFTVHNLSGAARTWRISADPIAAQTEDRGGIAYISELCREMRSNELTVTFSADTVTVQPGGSADLSVKLELTEQGREALSVFPNGIYIEGFIRLTGDDAPSLGLPYLGFYGDWADAPIFDSTMYDEEASFMAESGLVMMDYNGGCSCLGVNAITGNARAEWISYASRTADYYLITPMQGLLRAPKEICYSAVSDLDPENAVYVMGYENSLKSFYHTSGGYIHTDFVPWADSWQPIGGNDTDGYHYLEDGPYTYTIKARVDGETAYQTSSYPVCIDNQAPTVLSHSYEVIDGTPWLVIQVTDNHYVMAAQLVDGSGTKALSAAAAVEETEPGTVTTLRFDLTDVRADGYAQCRLEIYDYAGNNTVSDVISTDAGPADKSALRALYDAAVLELGRLSARVFPEALIAALEAAVSDAEAVLRDAGAAGAEVEQAAAALQTAYDALQAYPVNDRYTDIAAGTWFYDAVDFVTRYGCMNGMDGGTFAPGASINRAQFVVILHRLAGSPEVAIENPFEDVPNESWFADAVLWAYENGITTGADAAHFNPGGTLVRQNMVTFLMRFADTMGFDTSVRADLTGYADADQIAAHAREPMEWAVAGGILSGMSETTLGPDGIAKRAQVCVIIKRFITNFVW